MSKGRGIYSDSKVSDFLQSITENQSVGFLNEWNAGRNHREPLFYEKYPGSIVDTSQLKLMLDKAQGYGYKRVGFILDRGYFSKANIDYMDSCGYFVIITSEKMSAKDALHLYKSRDCSEKLFRGDKTYLGDKSLRVHTTESASAKIFIEFIALIIRNKIYTCLLYPTISQKGKYGASRVLTNFIAYCDGQNDLLDISD